MFETERKLLVVVLTLSILVFLTYLPTSNKSDSRLSAGMVVVGRMYPAPNLSIGYYPPKYETDEDILPLYVCLDQDLKDDSCNGSESDLFYNSVAHGWFLGENNYYLKEIYDFPDYDEMVYLFLSGRIRDKPNITLEGYIYEFKTPITYDMPVKLISGGRVKDYYINLNDGSLLIREVNGSWVDIRDVFSDYDVFFDSNTIIFLSKRKNLVRFVPVDVEYNTLKLTLDDLLTLEGSLTVNPNNKTDNSCFRLNKGRFISCDDGLTTPVLYFTFHNFTGVLVPYDDGLIFWEGVDVVYINEDLKITKYLRCDQESCLPAKIYNNQTSYGTMIFRRNNTLTFTIPDKRMGYHVVPTNR